MCDFMIDSVGYAAHSAEGKLGRFSFKRRDVGDMDVLIEISYCGICHSDIHEVKNEWGGSNYPLVPGHEIIGRVVEVGQNVKKFKVGELAGVGCMVGSCGKCEECTRGEEQNCKEGPVWTYNSIDPSTGEQTRGGYSNNIVVNEAFALKISKGVDEAATAPLMCAGITTYSPLKRWGAGPGKRVGVAGLGGLGHMAVKIAKAMGAEVTAITSSESKVNEARRLGAGRVILSRDKAVLEENRGYFDIVIDTIPAKHDIDAVLSMTRPGGAVVVVGLPPRSQRYELSASSVVGGGRIFAGSNIGGIRETQEMLDFCAKNGITADIEKIPPERINEAYDRAIKSDVRYRFVIDTSSLKN